jgi:diguanylate cyclase (GGDEF)-like protein
MVMQSFAMACAGLVLLSAWLQTRAVAALALWGVANVSGAAGILSLLSGFVSHQPALLGLGGALLSFQASLIWKAARTIDGKRAPFLLALAGPISVGLAGFIPLVRDFAGSVALAVGATYTAATAVVLWHGRDEGLAARWPLMTLATVHTAALLIGTFTTVTGSTGQDTVPSLKSLFGFIYFESIVFAVASSVFVLALLKERNEAAGRKAALIDPLTGIANRAGFMEYAGQLLARSRQERAPIAVMMFDLDRFKKVNDTNGHATGDVVLRKFCEITGAALRPNDVFGRIGGEEFAAVLAGCGVEAAHARADRVRIAFAAGCRRVGDRQVDATVSCGVAASPDAAHSLDEMLEQADAALYSAKFEGRNRVKRAEALKSKDSPATVIRVA